MLFSVAKDWQQSDQGEKKETALKVKALIDDWKTKFFGKKKNEKAAQAQGQSATSDTTAATPPNGLI